MKNMIDRHDQIIHWLRDTESYINKRASQKPVVQTKSFWKNLVTDLDDAIEKKWVSLIRSEYPGESIFGEEGHGDDIQTLDGVVWFVDPIDGTTNYITQNGNFAVMIGVYEDGIGQLGFIMDMNDGKIYSAKKGEGLFVNGEAMTPPTEDCSLREGLLAINSKIVNHKEFEIIRELSNNALGVRMLGSAGLEIVNVLKGNTAAYISSSLSPWDIAPGNVLVEESNILSTQIDGKGFSLLNSESAIFANPTAYQEVIEFIEKNSTR